MADVKTLRVCHSRDLPALNDRSFEYLYLAYDKLDLYTGKNNIEENYVITSEMPEEPVPGMIYILDTDGSVYRNIDYSNVQIATIEDASQVEFLKKAGTIFRVNVNRQYIDKHRRTLTLPFNDGKYELNVSVKNDQQFTKDTIAKFNPDRERFEIYGPMDEEFIDFSKPFRGGKTETMTIQADGPRIKAQVNVSKIVNNLLKKASDGLYIKPTNIVPREEFDKWAKDINDFKAHAQDILDNIDSNIKDMQDLISEDSVNETIQRILSEKFGDIQTALENYEDMVSRLLELQTSVMTYAVDQTLQTRAMLTESLANHSSWNDLDNTSETYTEEVDYYQKANEYLYPELDEDEVAAILTVVAQLIVTDQL